MLDKSASEQEIRFQLQAAIRNFANWASRSNWAERGKAHARQHGAFTQTFGNCAVTVTPESMEWRFICDRLSDDFTLIIREGGASWEILHDRYGTGENLVPIYNDDIRVVTGINKTQFWEISVGFRSSMEDFIEYYFGGPVATVRQMAKEPLPAAKFHWKNEYTPIAIAVGVVGLMLLCGVCCIGNYLLAV